MGIVTSFLCLLTGFAFNSSNEILDSVYWELITQSNSGGLLSGMGPRAMELQPKIVS